jgi:Transposase IS200 like
MGTVTRSRLAAGLEPTQRLLDGLLHLFHELSLPVPKTGVGCPQFRSVLFALLQSPGVLLHAIGGTDDHVPLAVTAPPTLLVSEWIGELKGASAHYGNHTLANRKVIEWQTGYGVVSFGAKAMP